MSRRSKILIGVIAVIVGIALAIVIPLSLSNGNEKRALALDLTVEASPTVAPTATVLAQPKETPNVTVATTAPAGQRVTSGISQITATPSFQALTAVSSKVPSLNYGSYSRTTWERVLKDKQLTDFTDGSDFAAAVMWFILNNKDKPSENLKDLRPALADVRLIEKVNVRWAGSYMQPEVVTVGHERELYKTYLFVRDEMEKGIWVGMTNGYRGRDPYLGKDVTDALTIHFKIRWDSATAKWMLVNVVSYRIPSLRE